MMTTTRNIIVKFMITKDKENNLERKRKMSHDLKKYNTIHDNGLPIRTRKVRTQWNNI
jgi:hypothetical protein